MKGGETHHPPDSVSRVNDCSCQLADEDVVFFYRSVKTTSWNQPKIKVFVAYVQTV